MSASHQQRQGSYQLFSSQQQQQSSHSDPKGYVDNSVCHATVVRSADALFAAVHLKSFLDDQQLLTLSILFAPIAAKALELVDNNAVVAVVATNSGRVLFEVKGSDKHPYICTHHHCSCPAFRSSVVLGVSLLCKHQLAARIAHAVNKCEIRELSDQLWTLLLMSDKNRSVPAYMIAKTASPARKQQQQ